jgi:hypothetical protein
MTEKYHRKSILKVKCLVLMLFEPVKIQISLFSRKKHDILFLRHHTYDILSNTDRLEIFKTIY